MYLGQVLVLHCRYDTATTYAALIRVKEYQLMLSCHYCSYLSCYLSRYLVRALEVFQHVPCTYFRGSHLREKEGLLLATVPNHQTIGLCDSTVVVTVNKLYTCKPPKMLPASKPTSEFQLVNLVNVDFTHDWCWTPHHFVSR
jgi:hypothetical protein